MSQRTLAKRRDAQDGLIERYVGHCVICSWKTDQYPAPVFAGNRVSGHARDDHPDTEGLVGYIEIVHVRRNLDRDDFKGHKLGS